MKLFRAALWSDLCQFLAGISCAAQIAAANLAPHSALWANRGRRIRPRRDFKPIIISVRGRSADTLINLLGGQKESKHNARN